MTTPRDLIIRLLSRPLDTPLSSDALLLDLILPSAPPTAPPAPLPAPSAPSPTRLSLADVAHAWTLYGDPFRVVSLSQIAQALGVSRAVLTTSLRRAIGNPFNVMVLRRSPGGDLSRHYTTRKN